MTIDQKSLAPFSKPVVFEQPQHLVAPLNWAGHLPLAFWLMQALRPRVFVELGAHTGVSFFGFCQAAKALEIPVSCYAVDTWHGDPQCGYYGEEIFGRFFSHNEKNYASFARPLRSTFDEARTHFEPGTVDLLHIDGYHTYDAVKHDFENWLPTLSDRGVVLLHDVNVREKDFGTARFWHEVSAKYPHFKFLHSHGLGVIAVGSNPPEEIRHLTEAESVSPELVAKIRDFFSVLGSGIIQRFNHEEAQRIHNSAQDGELQRLNVEVDYLRRVEKEYENVRVQIPALQAKLEKRERELADHRDALAANAEKLARLEIEEAAIRSQSYKGLMNGARQRRQAARVLQELRHRERDLHEIHISPQFRLAFKAERRLVRLRRWRAAAIRALSFVPWALTGKFRARRRELRAHDLISASGIFDPAYYLRNGDVPPDAASDLIMHYVRTGANLGLSPCALFDTAYYLRSNPDVAESGVNPLAHYLSSGGFERRDPCMLFNSRWYCEQAGIVDQREINPLKHYFAVGRFRGYSPNPLFDIDFYLSTNSDVAEAGMDSFSHYVHCGAKEGRDPHPLFDVDHYTTVATDVALPSVNPLEHYQTVGGRQGLSPHIFFDGEYYLEQRPEILRANQTPLAHYLSLGHLEDVNPHRLFDSKYYRLHNGVPADQNPLVHFVECGLIAGMNPLPTFDGAYYHSSNRDVYESRTAPYEHYVRHGFCENRKRSAVETLTYFEWIARYDRIASRDSLAIEKEIAEFDGGFEVSILIHVNGWTLEALSNTVESVLAQLFQNWKVIFAISGEVASDLMGQIARWQKMDARFAVVEADDKSEPLSAAFVRSKGDLIVVLDDAVRLSVHALYLVVRRFVCDGDVDVFYGDSDRLTKDGKRYQPFFKPDWDEFLFYANDFISGFAVFSRKFIERVGGFRNGFNGAEAYDLVLRGLKGPSPARVEHIPFVLSHLQQTLLPAVNRSVLRGNPVQSRADALRQHLANVKVSATVDVTSRGARKIVYLPDESQPLVTLIVPTRDRVGLLETCLSSIMTNTTYQNYEILVVDNDSEEPATRAYFSRLQHNPRVKVIPYSGPFNYAKLNNYAVSQANGEIVGFVNNDIEVISPGWLTELVGHLTQSDVAISGAQLFYPNDTIQHAGVIIGKNGVAGHVGSMRSRHDSGPNDIMGSARQVSAVTAACMCIWKDVFVQAGEFDAEKFAVAFNDIDLCLRVRAIGGKIVQVPAAELYHHESASRGPESNPARRPYFERECKSFQQRWASALETDPFYNGNLSLGRVDYELAVPPRVAIPWRSTHANLFSVEASRDPRLAPYASISNLSRSIEVTTTDGVKIEERRSKTPGISIAILNLNKPEFIIPLLDNLVEARAILAGEGITVDIIVGDTGSTDPAVLAKYSSLSDRITVERGMRYQFSVCNNLLFERHVVRDKVLFLNNDIIFEECAATLREAARQFEIDSRLGILGSYLFYPDGTLQHGGIDFFSDGPLQALCYHPGHAQTLAAVPQFGSCERVAAVTGAWLMIRSVLFHRAGRFDERYAAECQDVALCLAARRLGMHSNLLYAGRVIHFENGTRDKGAENWIDRQRFVRKWGSFVGTL